MWRVSLLLALTLLAGCAKRSDPTALRSGEVDVREVKLLDGTRCVVASGSSISGSGQAGVSIDCEWRKP